MPVLQLDRANHSTNDVTEVAESIYEKTGADEDLFTVRINPTRNLWGREILASVACRQFERTCRTGIILSVWRAGFETICPRGMPV